ncbi:hypothetical protein COU57_06820 [Candidatus Pacearchaeota archaeon CG10_big_fil_rev_8_21_14_0_10_32_14]|nr:MAG: hypothetical protein COU57_06820 [Candidatus Pacearchaeota archaeon CG10_big_fil_rev_8_21_14_0_10_32_14]
MSIYNLESKRTLTPDLLAYVIDGVIHGGGVLGDHRSIGGSESVPKKGGEMKIDFYEWTSK